MVRLAVRTLVTVTKTVWWCFEELGFLPAHCVQCAGVVVVSLWIGLIQFKN